MSENIIYRDTDGWIIFENMKVLAEKDCICNFYPPHMQIEPYSWILRNVGDKK